jgi:L-alanine-DL-glutamate epimerase-like enolase superfamily enzyme
MTDSLDQPIDSIEKVIIKSKRPRMIGLNARIGAHGDSVTDPVVRIRTRDGLAGVGWSGMGLEEAKGLLGSTPSDLFTLPAGSNEKGQVIDLPLWDLVARSKNQPLYELLGAQGSREVELYDGSIYIDDLEADKEQAVEIFHEEVRTGQSYGYRNFKIKIGRGARWMPIQDGLQRDELVIHTVRNAAGPDAKILIDANMGNTLNTAQETINRCVHADIYWFEEPFAEDPALNEAFKAYLQEHSPGTLVADGEFAPPPYFFDLVEKGWIDVVQHDFRAKGLTWWKATAARIEPWGALCAPHCWGSIIERYAHAHFAASISNYSLLEAAPADVPGIVLDGWDMRDGKLLVPDTRGAGFDLEPDVWKTGVTRENGFHITQS